MQIWNGSDEYSWRYRADTILSTDGQTDGRTDGQGDTSIPLYQLRWSGGCTIMRRSEDKYKLEQLECLRSEDTPRRLMITSGQTILLNDRADRSKPLRSIIDRNAKLRSIICRSFIIVKWTGLLLWKQCIIITVRLGIWDNSHLL